MKPNSYNSKHIHCCGSYLLLYFLISMILSIANFPQTIDDIKRDTTKHTQYRRGINLNESYQSYEQKYADKNINEEKRSLFPLKSETGVWTELNPKVPRVDYIGIHFVNKDTGWAVGDLGALIKTSDGGKNWKVSETNTTTPILKVRSYNGRIVVASGFNGLILRSEDGGETFEQISSGVTGDLWGLEIVNDTLGWACGNENSLTKTTDGGETWQRIFTPGYTSDYWWIDFMIESYGFIAANGKIIRTTNGGQNWQIIQAGDDYPLFSIDVIDSLHIAAAGYGGTSYRAKNIYSSDGGYTWINGGLLTFEPANCIQYVNPDTGYLVMNEVGLWKTTDQGQNWTIIQGIGEYEIQLFKNENIGYNVGSGLKLYKADGNLDVWNKKIINDNFVDVYFTNEAIGYAAANRVVYKTKNSGEDWFLIPNFPSDVFIGALGSLTFNDSLTGFAGGPPCRVVKTTDAGNSWYVTNITGLEDTLGTINKIFFINSSIGWAVTSRGGILKTKDSGENWFAQLNAGISVGFRSIHFLNYFDGWVISPGFGGIYNSTDGGLNWMQRMDIQIYNSSDIYFINSIGFITNFLELNKTTNSGNNWFTQLNSQYVIRNFGWLSSSHGFIVGDGVYETNDSGSIWHEIIELRNVGLKKFHSPKSYLGFSVGNIGLIYKYYDTTIVPVELNTFKGKVENNKIILSWLTVTELNNRGFEIEKSFDKINWFNIGFIEGRGTATELNYYSFTDNEITSNIQFYRLKQIDYDGSFEYSKILEVNSNLNITSDNLFQNYPNPFNPETNIDYIISEETLVNISLFDVTGRKIQELVYEKKQPGYYTIKLEGGELSSGIYFYRLLTGCGYSAINKLTIVK